MPKGRKKVLKKVQDDSDLFFVDKGLKQLPSHMAQKRARAEAEERKKLGESAVDVAKTRILGVERVISRADVMQKPFKMRKREDSEAVLTARLAKAALQPQKRDKKPRARQGVDLWTQEIPLRTKKQPKKRRLRGESLRARKLDTIAPVMAPIAAESVNPPRDAYLDLAAATATAYEADEASDAIRIKHLQAARRGVPLMGDTIQEMDSESEQEAEELSKKKLKELRRMKRERNQPVRGKFARAIARTEAAALSREARAEALAKMEAETVDDQIDEVELMAIEAAYKREEKTARMALPTNRAGVGRVAFEEPDFEVPLPSRILRAKGSLRLIPATQRATRHQMASLQRRGIIAVQSERSGPKSSRIEFGRMHWARED